jgi:preprotein translocase subunit YajC
MFFNTAWAQEAAAAAAPNNALMSLLPFIFIFGIFYFMLIRPQIKKQKEHQAMLDSVKRGEKVVTSGGIIGTIAKIDDDIIHLEVAPDFKIKVLKSAIMNITSRKDEASKDSKEPKENTEE